MISIASCCISRSLRRVGPRNLQINTPLLAAGMVYSVLLDDVFDPVALPDAVVGENRQRRQDQDRACTFQDGRSLSELNRSGGHTDDRLRQGSHAGHTDGKFVQYIE